MGTLAIPESGLFFEGHFPGRPILPGIVLLDLALRSAPGQAIEPGGLVNLRFHRVVPPGARLEVDVGPVESGRLPVVVRRGTERVATALVAPGDAAPDAARAPSGGTRLPSGVAQVPSGVARDLAIDSLLPHRLPALFVTGLLWSTDQGLVCEARVPRGHALAAKGPVPACAAIEMAAQAAGLFEAVGRREREGTSGQGPRPGYLVGARDVRFARRRMAAESTCVVSVRFDGASGPLSAYEFAVREGDAPIATGRVTTWLTATDA
jgi:3-hydroxyacyl-[acyl-carrier-protein] dehydratase